MQTIKIINPDTKRQNKARCWFIEPKKVYEWMKAHVEKEAAYETEMKRIEALPEAERPTKLPVKPPIFSKWLSWELLNDSQSVKAMQRELDGDAADTNFALQVFEAALDWRIGFAVVTYMSNVRQVAKENGRTAIAKPFYVAVTRQGAVAVLRDDADKTIVWWDK